MTASRANIKSVLSDFPATLALVNVALAAWPEHDKYLTTSFQSRSRDLLDVGESIAVAVFRLMGTEEIRFGEDYRWTCDRLRDEELYFHMEGRYRLSTFA